MPLLLTNAEVDEKTKVRGRVGMVCATIIVILLVGLVAGTILLQPWLARVVPMIRAQYGETVATVVGVAPVFYFIVLLFGLGALTDPWLEKTKLTCSHCSAEMRLKSLKTRRCEKCGEHAIEGRPRSDAVWERYRRCLQHRSLPTMLWLFTAMGILCGLIMLSPAMAAIGGIIGAPLGVYVILRVLIERRTLDWRLVWPTLVALAELGLGVIEVVRNWP